MNTRHTLLKPIFLAQLLALCPLLVLCETLAVALCMSIYVAFALLCCAIIATTLSCKFMSSKYDLVVDIAVIAGVISASEMLLQTFSYPAYQQIGFLFPLIAISCWLIIKNLKNTQTSHMEKLKETLHLVIGCSLLLLSFGGVRELLSSGQLLSEFDYLFNNSESYGMLTLFTMKEYVLFAILPSMGFVLMGCVIALNNLIQSKTHKPNHSTDETYKLRRVRITGIIN